MFSSHDAIGFLFVPKVFSISQIDHIKFLFWANQALVQPIQPWLSIKKPNVYISNDRQS